MIDGSLNQTAVWKRVTGKNEYGEPITVDADIKVRWEGKRRLVRNKKGEEVVSEARVFCRENVQPGDLLKYGGREWPVISISETPGLDGTVLYRECSV